MKIILLFLLFSSCLSTNKLTEKPLQHEKRWNYGRITVVTGFKDQKPIIKILQNSVQVFSRSGGDAAYGDIDTLDINKDGMVDFVFESKYEDGSTIGMLVSIKKKHTYKIYNITNDILNRYDCLTAPYNQSDSRLKSFILIDIDKNKKRDIVTMAVRNKQGAIEFTDCSKIILYEEIVKIAIGRPG